MLLCSFYLEIIFYTYLLESLTGSLMYLGTNILFEEKMNSKLIIGVSTSL